VGDVDTTPKSRHIPAAVRRVVHERDGGRCTYETKHGRRCTKRHDLEIHHKRPYGKRGIHSPKNLALMCAPHNALMAEHDYGKEVMARFRRSGGRGQVLGAQ
jgi:5-methylcytosine-specific restriction endonuclease McrA